MEQILRDYSAADFDGLAGLRVIAAGRVSEAGAGLARGAGPGDYSEFDPVRVEPVPVLVQPDAGKRIFSGHGGAVCGFGAYVRRQPKHRFAAARGYAAG